MNDTDGNRLLDPARTIIDRFSTSEACGVSVVSEITGVGVTGVRKWRYPKERGGTGGYIPPRHWMKLKREGRVRGISLPADCVPDYETEESFGGSKVG